MRNPKTSSITPRPNLSPCPVTFRPNLWHRLQPVISRHRLKPVPQFRRILVAAILCAIPLLAVDTKVWTQNEMSDLEKGELTHLSLSSDGRLHVAPTVQE